MSRYIPSERQAIALADAENLSRRALAVGITRKQLHACATLKDARALVEYAEMYTEACAMNEDYNEAVRLTIKFKLPGYEKHAAPPAAAPEADGDPCSMTDFPTLGDDVDADERDREAEISHARHG